MKKFLIGSALAIMPLAYAQDCCYPPQCNPCCGPDFSGLYFGGNIGVSTHVAHRADLDGGLTDNSGWTTLNTTVAGGLQLGYDWQCCSKLFGVVWDWNWARHDETLVNDPNAVGVDSFIQSRSPWFTTIRARAGLTVGDALVYLTLGGAIARFETNWVDTPSAFSFTDRRSRCGWVGGVGTEFLVWCNWSVGLEVLVLNFHHHVQSFTSPAGATFDFGHSDTVYFGRVLINYRFGDLCNW